MLIARRGIGHCSSPSNAKTAYGTSHMVGCQDSNPQLRDRFDDSAGYQVDLTPLPVGLSC